jgi:hypothetical protein
LLPTRYNDYRDKAHIAGGYQSREGADLTPLTVHIIRVYLPNNSLTVKRPKSGLSMAAIASPT